MSAGSATVRVEAAAINARLDRLPPTRYVWRIVTLLSLGGCFEFYDLFFMTYIGPGLVRSGFFTSASQRFFGFSGLAAFVASTFAGLFVGTLAFGFVADRFGRRAIFTISLLWYALASLVMAFQHTPNGLLLWRMIAGVGIGVEFVTIDAYIAELVPRQMRGRAFAVNQVIEFAVVPVVAFVSWLLVPRHPLGLDGWRWVVLIGTAGAAFVWLIRRRIPESPRWLIARGRLEEAEAITVAIEEKVEREFGSPLPAPKNVATDEPRGNFLQIFRAPYGGRTLMLTTFNFFQTIGYYGFASWVPTLLIANGMGITSSLEYSFVIAIAAPFGPLAGWAVADRFERKWQIVWSALCIAAFGLLFARQRSPVALITCGVLLTCANNWLSFAFHAYQAELFPTRVRAQAVGFVYCWSRLSAILASFLIGFFLRDFGTRGVFSLIAASMGIVMLAIGVFGPRTRGLALEAIS
jgi:putative MFS transporter